MGSGVHLHFNDQVTTVPLLGNLFLPSFLCLIGALSYEYFQMEDKPFVRDLNEKQDSESLEVPVGQGLAPSLHAGRCLVICAAMRENEHSSKSLLVLVISRFDGVGLHFPQSMFQGLIVAVLSHWFLAYSASTRRNIAISLPPNKLRSFGAAFVAWFLCQSSQLWHNAPHGAEWC